MPEHIKKTIPWIAVLAVIVLVVIVGLNFKDLKVQADTADTTVVVGNAVPSFTVDPVEDPASHSGTGTGDTANNPTNVGSNVTFKATATDTNGDNYYLAICKSAAVTPGTGGGAPTCDGGEWCISSSTSSGSEASCTYTALAGDNESNAWHAYACDAASSSQECSSVSQGTGNSGSPFYVNHLPTFTAYQDDSGKDPGETVTWTTTSEDPDSDAADDTVTLYVCTTSNFTSGGSPACDDGEWCHDASPGTSDSSCTYDIPSVYPDQNLSAYGFIVDNHGLAASGGSQGTDSTLTVDNVAPSITDTTIALKDTDGTGNLELTTEEGETEGFYVEFVVADNNSCQTSASGNEIASAVVHIRMSEIAQASCDDDAEDNNNNCYANAHTGINGSCSQDESVDACSGTSDSTVGWKCVFPLQYHADPTVAGDYLKAAYIWLAAVKATDDDGFDTGLVDDSDGTELDTLVMYDVDNGSASINYGSLSPEDTSADQTNTIEATGNVGLDTTLYGTDMTSGGNTIAVGQQKYDTAANPYGSMTALLVDPGAELELNVGKTITTGSPAYANIHWKIQIPTAQEAGTYTGTNTIVGKVSESAGW